MFLFNFCIRSFSLLWDVALQLFILVNGKVKKKMSIMNTFIDILYMQAKWPNRATWNFVSRFEEVRIAFEGELPFNLGDLRSYHKTDG